MENTVNIERNLRKNRVGIVVSDKMDKTIVVAIEQRVKNFAVYITKCIFA